MRSTFGIERSSSFFRNFSRKFYPANFTLFLTIAAFIEGIKAKRNFVGNHFHNILRVFDVLRNFFSPKVNYQYFNLLIIIIIIIIIAIIIVIIIIVMVK